jgi:hypothetical protein
MRTQINNTLLFAAMILAGFGSKTNAQPGNTPAAVQKFRIGFKFSPNFTWTKIMEGPMKNNGTNLGYSYGVMMDFNMGNNPNYWLSTEMIITNFPTSVKSTETLYNTKFPVAGVDNKFTNVKFDYKIQYIQIPVSIKLRTGDIGRMHYFGQFGFAPSIIMQNKVITTADQQFYLPGSTNGHNPNSDANNTFDFDGSSGTGVFKDNVLFARLPMIIGAGVEGKISGSTMYMLGIRLDNSFTDMFLDKKVKGRSNYIALNLGIFF